MNRHIISRKIECFMLRFSQLKRNKEKYIKFSKTFNQTSHPQGPQKFFKLHFLCIYYSNSKNLTAFNIFRITDLVTSMDVYLWPGNHISTIYLSVCLDISKPFTRIWNLDVQLQISLLSRLCLLQKYWVVFLPCTL